jgi:Methyltransferase domain
MPAPEPSLDSDRRDPSAPLPPVQGPPEPLPFEPNTPYASTLDNRPAPLEHSPLALTRENQSQMSFGERAALEGVLAQVRPRLAVEIGTAEGGSLARIAAHSAEAHSIDLTHGPVTAELGEHVHLHTGPSAQLLPGLLREFSSTGRLVDFALVDGDHSFEGVTGDLRALLDSPSTARSVILVHDTMNEEVRAGIESFGLDRCEKIVYYELDFVPGYIYREGTARGSVWGGLGLILCDTTRSAAYSSSPRQWRYHEPYAAIHRMRAELLAPAGNDSPRGPIESDGQSNGELGRVCAELAAAEAERARQAQALQTVYRSRSWRLTEPLRAAARRMRAQRTD